TKASQPRKRAPANRARAPIGAKFHTGGSKRSHAVTRQAPIASSRAMRSKRLGGVVPFIAGITSSCLGLGLAGYRKGGGAEEQAESFRCSWGRQDACREPPGRQDACPTKTQQLHRAGGSISRSFTKRL